jgi:hypothetical protein
MTFIESRMTRLSGLREILDNTENREKTHQLGEDNCLWVMDNKRTLCLGKIELRT